MRIIVVLSPDLKSHMYIIITVLSQDIETTWIEIYIKGNFFWSFKQEPESQTFWEYVKYMPLLTEYKDKPNIKYGD